MNGIKLKQKAKGARPYFFEDPAIDRLIAIISALAGEVSVLHDQVDTITRLLNQKGTVTSEDVDSFVPDEGVESARDQWRALFLENIFRIIQQEREAMEEGNQTNESYMAAIAEAEEA